MVSIYDVAQAVGVSASTVSFVLNGRADEMRISPKTRERVIQMANQMGYIPNVAAIKLSDRKASRVPEIALLWSPVQHNSFLNVFISNLQRMISAGEIRDMRFTIIPFYPGELKNFAPMLTANHFNGIIVPPVSTEDIEMLQQSPISVPVILLHGDTSRFSIVTVNNEATGRKVAELFHQHGHACVGIVSPAALEDSLPVKQRISGFIEVCQTYDMKVSLLASGHQRIPSDLQNLDFGRDIGRQIADSDAMPSAFFVQNDYLSIGVVDGLKSRNIRIPEEIEVVTYGSNVALELSTPTITGVEYPMEDISRTAIELMTQMLDSPVKTQVRKVFDPPIIFRQSCPEHRIRRPQ